MKQKGRYSQDAGGEAGPRVPDPGDEDLLRRISDGDEASFLSLFRRWAPRLGRFLSNATGSHETAEDLLQETFVRILRGAPRFEPRGSAGAWIYRIAANVVYSHWRRERIRPMHGAVGAEALATVAAPASAMPDSERLRRAFLSDTRTALDRIDDNKRIVFLMKVDQGMTYEEIAAVLSCPVGTAKSRFHHAVRRLRQELNGKSWQNDAMTQGRESDVE